MLRKFISFINSNPILYEVGLFLLLCTFKPLHDPGGYNFHVFANYFIKPNYWSYFLDGVCCKGGIAIFAQGAFWYCKPTSLNQRIMKSIFLILMVDAIFDLCDLIITGDQPGHSIILFNDVTVGVATLFNNLVVGVTIIFAWYKYLRNVRNTGSSAESK